MTTMEIEVKPAEAEALALLESLLTEEQLNQFRHNGEIRVPSGVWRGYYWLINCLGRPHLCRGQGYTPIARCIGVIQGATPARPPHWYRDGTREEQYLERVAFLLALRTDEKLVNHQAG